MKLQLPCPISDSLLLLVVQVVLRHVAGDWGSAIPFVIEALPFPSGLGRWHSPSAAVGGAVVLLSPAQGLHRLMSATTAKSISKVKPSSRLGTKLTCGVVWCS